MGAAACQRLTAGQGQPGQQKPGCLRVLVEAVRLPDLAAGLPWRHG
jgi:hypothetical protein